MSRRSKQPITADDLEKIARDLRVRSVAISAIAKSVAKRQPESIDITGQAMVERSIPHLDTLIHNCRKALGEI